MRTDDIIILCICILAFIVAGGGLWAILLLEQIRSDQLRFMSRIKSITSMKVQGVRKTTIKLEALESDNPNV